VEEFLTENASVYQLGSKYLVLVGYVKGREIMSKQCVVLALSIPYYCV
jgi:hypothetical protein